MIQNVGLKRDRIDKFYTCAAAVAFCMNLVKKHVTIDAVRDLVIEPSAGNGSFISAIKSLSSRCEFYDLAPEHPDVLAQDYLEFAFMGGCKRVHVIGNPPFGRQSSCAIKFIKKSCSFCDTVSFILPKSFKKTSLQRAFPQSFHLVCEADLPDDSFLVDGATHDVPCVFQIWEKRECDRAVVEKMMPEGFEFVNESDTHDISFRRVGVNAGTISQGDKKSVQSHYFIRFTNGLSVDANIARLTVIKYDFNNTVGPKSISKQELISEFNPLLRV